MSTNFYKKNGSYFNTTDNAKILNPTDLQALAKAGGKEISAPTFDNVQSSTGQNINPADPNYSTYKSQSNKIDSSTIQFGINNSGVSSQLPSANNKAQSLYLDKTIADGTKTLVELQAQLDQLKAQRIKDNGTALNVEQANLKSLQEKKDTQIANYDTQMNPLKDKAVGIYDSMLNSIKDTNYSELTKQKLDLTNSIVTYSKMFNDEIAQTEAQGGLSSVSTNRKNQVIENYTSKIAIAQAASSAIDGNFTLAFDIMDKGANAISSLTTDRINLLNIVKGIYDQDISDSKTKINGLTSDEKKLLDQAVTDAQSKLDNIQKNKDSIMEVMKTNPIIASKAGLSLADTPEQTTKKLNDFYVSNPQYTPQNQDFIKKAMEKYYDAGITMNDPIETVKSKILNSRIYEKETSGKYTMTTDPITGEPIVFNTTTGVVGNGTVQIPQTSKLASVNNNPGNLKFNNQPGATLGEGGFAKFDTPEAGYQALINQIKLDASRGLTLSEFINKYAPSSENDTALYVSQISQATSTDPNTPISKIDTNLLAQAIAKKESGTIINNKSNNNGTYHPTGNTILDNLSKLSMSTPGYFDTLSSAQKTAVTTNLAKQGLAPATNSKPATETEKTTNVYATRMKEADAIFNKFEVDNPKTGLYGTFQSMLPDWGITNWLKSSEFQQYEQAERNFVNAVLRKESGAAISPTEFDSARKQYFPQPGDSAKVIAQKKLNRQTAIQGFITASGPAANNPINDRITVVSPDGKEGTIPANQLSDALKEGYKQK